MSREAEKTPMATARASSFWRSVAWRLLCRLPRRSISTRSVAGPGITGPAMSPVSVRSLRAGSSTTCSIARVSIPYTRPPNAPRPCCQPSGTVTSKLPGPVRRTTLASSKEGIIGRVLPQVAAGGHPRGGSPRLEHVPAAQLDAPIDRRRPGGEVLLEPGVLEPEADGLRSVPEHSAARVLLTNHHVLVPVRQCRGVERLEVGVVRGEGQPGAPGQPVLQADEERLVGDCLEVPGGVESHQARVDR